MQLDERIVLFGFLFVFTSFRQRQSVLVVAAGLGVCFWCGVSVAIVDPAEGQDSLLGYPVFVGVYVL